MAKQKRETNKNYPGCFLVSGVLYCSYRHPVTKKRTNTKFGRKDAYHTWAKCAKYRFKLSTGEIKSPQELRAEQKAEEALAAEKQIESESYTIEALYEKYLDHYDSKEQKLNREKGGAHRETKKFEKHIFPHFGDKDMRTLTEGDIEEFRKEINGTKKEDGSAYSEQTQVHILSGLRKILNFNKILFPREFWNINIPPIKKRKYKKGILTPEEIDRVNAVLDRRPDYPIAMMIRLAMIYGVRSSELTRLRWENVRLKSRMLHIVERKNGAKDLAFAMTDAAFEIFKKMRGNEVRQKKSLVFPSAVGKVRDSSTVSHQVRALLNQAEISHDFRPMHGFRDNCAYYLKHTYGIEAAQKYLGHEHQSTTEGYVESIEDGHIEGISAMTAIMGGK